MANRVVGFVRSRPWVVATVVLAIGLAVSLIALATQSSGEGDEVASSTTTPTPGSTTTSGDTGADRLAIVVDNAPAARPQVGLGTASLLVEYPVEGGITRFVAVVPDGSEGLIGPVRSLRPLNAPLLPTLASTVVSTGGQPFVLQDIEAAGLTSVTPLTTPGFISMGRPEPHDVFVDLLQLGGAFVPGPPVPGLPIGGALPATRTAATAVDLPFAGDVTYTYEEGTGYIRSEGDQPFEVLDPTGSETMSLAHQTIVILYAAERPAGYTDANGVPVSTFDVVGSGELGVLHEGEMIVGRWSRSALADPFVFTDGEGATFGLPDASTYLAIVPRDDEIVTR